MCADAFACRPSDLLERDPQVETALDKLRAIMAKAPADEQRRIIAVAKTMLENKG